MSELLTRVNKNDIDDFDRHLNRSLNSIIERVNEMDEVSKSMQRNYIQRLTKILETRKQAEVNFLDERKKFTSMIRDIEMAYQRKNEAFQLRLKKELTLIKNAYDKIKDENGTLDSPEILLSQLLNSQKIAEDVIARLKKKEEEHKSEMDEVRLEYTRLMEDVASATQNQGAKIVEKIESLRVHLSVFEREKIDQSIYRDFIKEIEMLSARIFVLEKHLMEMRSSDKSANFESKANLNLEKLVQRVNSNIDHIHQLGEKGNDIVSIRALVQNLNSMIIKEDKLEKLIEEVHGFMEYFNDQWNKFNVKSMEQNSAISKLEREKIVAALEKLRTPRDVAYELEIKRLNEKYARLDADYSATRQMLSEMEDLLSQSDNSALIDLSKVVRSELVHIKTLRDTYETAITQVQLDSSQ